jgi:hypothetical protein
MITEILRKQKTITQAILQLRIHYGEYGVRPDVINTGQCMDFAYEIARLGFGSDVWGNEVLLENWSSEFQYIANGNLANYKLVIQYMECHCFIEYEGKYYDSECPQGCDYPDQLPCYVRLQEYYFGRTWGW